MATYETETTKKELVEIENGFYKRSVMHFCINGEKAVVVSGGDCDYPQIYQISTKVLAKYYHEWEAINSSEFFAEMQKVSGLISKIVGAE